MMIRNPAFLQLLVSRNVLSENERAKLSAQFNQNALEILTYLVKKSGHPRDELGKMWGDSLGCSYVPLDKCLFQKEAVIKLPREFAVRNNVILMYQFGDAITAACANPLDFALVDNISSITKTKISSVFSLPEDIQNAIEIQYLSGDSIKGLSTEASNNVLIREGANITLEQLRTASGDQAIVKLTTDMTLLAIRERASDIHIEPMEDKVRVRYRIDGALQEVFVLDKPVHAPLVSRLKVLASLDISERRRPQDGRISFAAQNTVLDIRFSCTPTIYGEKVVLRLLGQGASKGIPKLEELQCSTPVYTKLRKVIESPNGIFFVTGPTGSGKTTTLFSVLQHLNKPDVNVMTIEDPIEYRLTGVNQLQANSEIGLDFAAALRSFLRQDPDIILIGEIRDLETARIAAQAALTGHLVLATLHTNSALQAITRLIDIGVEPFLVAPSIIGVMAQRLVRKICTNCKERYTLSPEKTHELFVWDGKQEVFFYRGKGCLSCNNTGYSGRIAIHEVFIITDEIRDLISHNASIIDIQKAAVSLGYKDLRYDGMKKVLRGLTTLDELNIVTFSL